MADARTSHPTIALSTRVGNQDVHGIVEWRGSSLSGRCISPYVGLSCVHVRMRDLYYHMSSVNPSVLSDGTWTDDTLAAAEWLLRCSYIGARQKSDPALAPDISALHNTWPELDARADRRNFTDRFLAGHGLISIKHLTDDVELMANDQAIAVLDRKIRDVFYMYEYDVVSIGGLRVATRFRHWRNWFSDVIAEGISDGIFFDSLLTRVDAVLSGPWRRATHDFWRGRVLGARGRGLPVTGFDLRTLSVVPAEGYLDYSPSREDFGEEKEKEHDTPCLLFSLSKFVIR